MTRRDPREVFAHNFQGVLKAQGVKQNYLADELGVSRGTVNRWANAKSTPGPDEMMQLAERLNWSYAAMYAEPGDVAEGDGFDEIVADLEQVVRRLKGEG